MKLLVGLVVLGFFIKLMIRLKVWTGMFEDEEFNAVIVSLFYAELTE